MTQLAEPTVTQLVKILVVDDEPETFAEVNEALANEVVVCSHCEFVEDLPRFESEDFAVCVLDIKFGDATRIQELLPQVRAMWSNAAIIILSNFPGSLDEALRHDLIVVSKLRFNQDPSLLCRKVIECLSAKGVVDKGILNRYVKGAKQPAHRLTTREIELFRMEGYVAEIDDPYVDVIIRETKLGESFFKCIFSTSFYADLLRPHELGTVKRLRMRYASFQAEGIGQDMSFMYRIFRKGGELVAKVSLVDDLQRPMEDFDLASDLEHLKKVEDEMIARAIEERKHAR